MSQILGAHAGTTHRALLCLGMLLILVYVGCSTDHPGNSATPTSPDAGSDAMSTGPDAAAAPAEPPVPTAPAQAGSPLQIGSADGGISLICAPAECLGTDGSCYGPCTGGGTCSLSMSGAV
jgi:hypothetical protein